MANYEATARSNYFRVRDAKAFEEFVDSLGVEAVPDSEGRYAILDRDGTGLPASRYSIEAGEWVDVDFVALLSEHLPDREVAILMEVGHEGSRYISGHAIALNNEGKVVQLNLSDIYGLALKEFGVEPARAEY
jgi:hypothetical protein